MDVPDETRSIFTAEIEIWEETPVITLPESEFSDGGLEVGERYRIAVLPTVGDETGGNRRSAPREHDQPPVEVGDVREVEIEDMGEKGDGLARIGPGFVIFVPNTTVGDRVTIEITEARDNVAFGKVVGDEPLSE